MARWAATVNVGQSLGELQLRVAQLEDVLKQHGIQIPAVLTGRPAPASPEAPKVHRLSREDESAPTPLVVSYAPIGLRPSVRALLAASEQPLTVDEITKSLKMFDRRKVAQNLSVSVTQGYFVREGSGVAAKYRLP